MKSFFYTTLTFLISHPLFLIANNNPIKPPHYRGLCVLSDSLAWLSGSKGTVIRTTDGGKHFDTISPRPNNTQFAHFLPFGKRTIESYTQTLNPSFSLLRKDYRDIWAKNENEAVILSAGDSAIILKTIDGGKNWTIVFIDFRKDIFLDVLEVDSKTGIGIVLGDPILPDPIVVEVGCDQNNEATQLSMQNSHQKTQRQKTKHQITSIPKPSFQTSNSNIPLNQQKHFASIYTTDFGSSWNPLPIGDWNLPLDSLESFFAASGTSLVIIDSKTTKMKKATPPQFKSLTVGFAGGGINPSYHIVQFKAKKMKSAHPNHPQLNIQAQLRVVANEVIPLPFKGGPGSGVYGMCLSDAGNAVAVGGNYTLPDSSVKASAHTSSNNFGLKWSGSNGPKGNTGGYRSGVCISAPIMTHEPKMQPRTETQTPLSNTIDTATHFSCAEGSRIAFCTGTNGSDISSNNGVSWYSIPKQTLQSGIYFEGSFNACAFSCNHLWMVGNSGKFQRIPITDLLSIGIKQPK